MKKSIDIDEIIWVKANIEAEKRGISIDDLVKTSIGSIPWHGYKKDMIEE